MGSVSKITRGVRFHPFRNARRLIRYIVEIAVADLEISTSITPPNSPNLSPVDTRLITENRQLDSKRVEVARGSAVSNPREKGEWELVQDAVNDVIPLSFLPPDISSEASASSDETFSTMSDIDTLSDATSDAFSETDVALSVGSSEQATKTRYH